jgi:hypothetical protein
LYRVSPAVTRPSGTETNARLLASADLLPPGTPPLWAVGIIVVFAPLAYRKTRAFLGAADTAEAGCRSRVDFDTLCGPAPPDGVVPIDTDTRHTDARDAAGRVTSAVRSAPHSRRYLKKIDSMLRSNLASEITAMLSATGHRLAVCAGIPGHRPDHTRRRAAGRRRADR